MENDKIDIVYLWVDGSDKNWQNAATPLKYGLCGDFFYYKKNKYHKRVKKGCNFVIIVYNSNVFVTSL